MHEIAGYVLLLIASVLRRFVILVVRFKGLLHSHSAGIQWTRRRFLPMGKATPLDNPLLSSREILKRAHEQNVDLSRWPERVSFLIDQLVDFPATDESTPPESKKPPTV